MPTKKDKIALVKYLEEKDRRRKQNLALKYFKALYPWQLDFIASTKDYYESCLMAGNQVGKSLVGTTKDAFDLMGNYPDDWPGYRYAFPPLIWCLGFSMEKTRDILQTAIFGKYDKRTGFTGGLVPKDRIISWEACIGIPNSMRTVRVKHERGVSTVQFWSYSQSQHALMGDVVDGFHIDEEPRDQTIRPQVLTRTINGDRGKGGRGIYTFTPENGSTELVIQFRDNPTKHQFFMQKGWKDAPHMTVEKCDRLMEQFPEHQRKMRSEGDALLGRGRIYDIADDFILCEPFEVPDHWKIICGVDFGFDHPQSIVKLAYDLENDTIYVINSWKQREVSPNDAFGACKWARGYPVAWPLDGLHNENRSGGSAKVKNLYRDAGFKMLPEAASWPQTTDVNGNIKNGGRSVEAGIFDIIGRARKGLFKVFKGQIDFMEEWRQYHRDDNENIVKVRDDMLDACRYALMMLRFARYNEQITNRKHVMPEPIGVIGIGA